jgi:hypothetical protein
MDYSIRTSQHSHIWGRIALALILALALSTTGNRLAYASHANTPVEQANIIPVTSAGVQAQNCEEDNLELCLHGGPEYTQTSLVFVPVTGGGMDFGYSYWLVVGPAGGQPINIGMTGK